MLSAKLDQPFDPILSKSKDKIDKKNKISKKMFETKEYEFVTMLGCDFNFSNPMVFVERYLRILS